MVYSTPFGVVHPEPIFLRFAPEVIHIKAFQALRLQNHESEYCGRMNYRNTIISQSAMLDYQQKQTTKSYQIKISYAAVMIRNKPQKSKLNTDYPCCFNHQKHSTKIHINIALQTETDCRSPKDFNFNNRGCNPRKNKVTPYNPERVE